MRSLLLLLPVLFAQTACSSDNCSATTASMLTMSGTLTIPDSVVDSLSMQLCWDSVCTQWTAQDAADASIIDAGMTAYYEPFSGPSAGASFTFTQTAPNTYAFKAVWIVDVDPSGTATHGTVTWTITSGGTTIYAATIPATYQTGTTCGTPYESCNLVLEPEWVSNPADAQ